MDMHTATYSPEDNKLRLYPAHRLDAETYNQVKSAGFSWAPRQELFVAPMWTPAREDLLIELCGEIGDEDTSLVDRAEQRAERFEDYSDNRRQDAERAKEAVDVIAERFHMGQPILVGHHSEKRARKDAERITNGMRRAIRLWDTAQYWQSRAKGAIRAAKYKERPDVRARRIKRLEADKRKQERTRADFETAIKIWSGITDTDKALFIAGHTSTAGYGMYSDLREGKVTGEEAARRVVENAQRSIAHCDRWIAHYSNRLEYERAMLAENGGTADGRPKAAAFDLQVGGRVLVGRDWLTVTKINRKAGEVVSVTTNSEYCRVKSLEEISDYQAPTAEQAEKVKAATRQLPLVNFRAPNCLEMTTAQWNERKKYSSAGIWYYNEKGTEAKHGMIGEGKAVYRQRSILGKNWVHVPVFLTDAKVTPPPTPAPAGNPEPCDECGGKGFTNPDGSANNAFEGSDMDPVVPCPSCEPPTLKVLRETLRAGVQVVSAPQLFPTPPGLAARMVEEADIQSGQCVLEPSAGTGNLVRAVLDRVDTEVLAYEVNSKLCEHLSRTFPSYKLQVRCKDFLEVTDFAGCYERILMNPPFENGADIKHIQHALTMLKPGGRLVALCANGPRQREKLMPIVMQRNGKWEDLPRDTFKESGTGVNAAMIVLNA